MEYKNYINKLQLQEVIRNVCRNNNLPIRIESTLRMRYTYNTSVEVRLACYLYILSNRNSSTLI